MASIVKGTVTIPAATGALSKITCTDPKAIVLWGTYQTAVGVTTTVDRRWEVGYGTYRGSVVQQCYGSCWGDDGATTSAYAESVNSSSLLRVPASAAATDFDIALTSMVSDGVNLTVTDAPTTGNIVLHYWIICGSEIDAEAKLFALSTAVATQDVTLLSGMGNPGDGNPWLSIFSKVQRTTAGLGAGDVGFSLGFDNGTNSAATLWGGDTGVGNMVLGGWQKTGRSILGFTAAAGTADVEANIDSTGHPTDGFQLAYADQATIGCQVASLHIRGLESVIGETTSRTTTGNQTITVGQTPLGAMFAGNCLDVKTTIDTAHASLGAQWIGGTDFTTEGCAGMLDDDALGFDNSILWHNTTQAVEMRGASGVENGNTLLAAADASISGTDVQLAYTTAPAAARGILHLIVYSVGGAPPAADIPSLAMPTHQGAY
jgi:hypothetical protein